MTAPAVRAVLFDFGGVISERAFEAFWAFERSRNLKPARAMGMRTIKVAGAAQALAELESLLGI